MINNHIGTALQIFKEIADELGYNYSHGNLTEKTLKAVNVYPYQHVTIQNISLSDSVATMQFNISICDILNFLKGENEDLDLETLYSKIGYTENTNYSSVVQNLYVQFALKLRQKEQQYYSQFRYQRPIMFTPFIENTSDVTAGFDIQITFDIISPFVTDCYDEISPN